MHTHVFIIAEAGVNHNGDIMIARKLIDYASDSGVDAIKFQTFNAEKLVSGNASKADYQLTSTSKDESQLEMLRRLELSYHDHRILKNYCREKGVQFLSSPFDIESADFLLELGINIFKIPSGEINNLPFLRHIGNFGKEVILSTGMSTLVEIESALEILTTSGTNINLITVLHCNTEYPTPFEDVNLRAMLTIRDKLGVSIGYSDHTQGIDVPIAAVALGALVIEKHFTLDRKMEGPDHKSSLEPDELKKMVHSIRNIEHAISGNGTKEPSKSEKKNLLIARKSIHLSRSLKEGSAIDENCLISLRPGDGISPMNWDAVIGKQVARDLPLLHKIKWEDLI